MNFKNTEDGLITGILVWDLSAAFDTVDTELLCLKLSLYGFDKKSCDWFHSFLTGRSQRVRIGNSTSPSLKLSSGAEILETTFSFRKFQAVP